MNRIDSSINIDRLSFISIFGDNGINEDRYGYSNGFFWVMDGATGLNEKNLVDKKSDAMWFTNWWNRYLHYTLKDSSDIVEVIYSGIEQIKDEFLSQVDTSDIHKINFPSASIAVVKLEGNRISYFILGDCRIYVENSKGNNVIMDNRVNALDEIVFDKMGKIEDFENMPLFLSRYMVMLQIIENRLLNNTDEGYWILSFSKKAAEKAMVGEFTIDETSKILICSDGFYAASEKYNIVSDENLLSETAKKGVVGMCMDIRKFEGTKEKICKIPRFKDRDDCTAILIEFNDNKSNH